VLCVKSGVLSVKLAMPFFCCLLCEPGSSSSPGAIEAIARACSPRVQFDLGASACAEPPGVIFDIGGLQRVLGPPAVIAAEVARLASARGLAVRVVVAGTMTAACLLAHARSGITVAAAGEEAVALAGLGLGTLRGLGPHQDLLAILSRWGLRTLGDLAKLPEAEVRTRLGPMGLRLHRAARGLDDTPLVPVAQPAKFSERIELEWPIEGLEPLSFVLGRLCEPLAATLERADRGAVAITTRLRLVTRATHERTLSLPAPIREARVLRTLILLDLESHPPPAGIDVVEIDLDVTPGRIVQGSLLARALPSADTLATLVARLSSLMGETRVGAPALVDSHDERAVAMRAFDPGPRPTAQGPSKATNLPLEPRAQNLGPVASGLGPALRRFRLPIAAQVTVEHGAPVHVRPTSPGWPAGRVRTRAGPFRSSGHWWTAHDRAAWARDEWEVEIESAEGGGLYRLARDHATGRWEIEGTFD
jgi:protein ImuB